MSSIFGGSKSKQDSQNTSTQQSSSSNQAYPFLQQQYGGQINQGLGASNFMAQLLGLPNSGDPSAANSAFDDYKNSTGYNFMMDSGRKAITGNAAANGLLDSGSTLKALNTYGQNTGSSFFNAYLDKLLGLSQQGLGAGGLISGAGQQSSSTGYSQGTSSGTSSSSPGIGQFLGTIASAVAASDPRLKLDITRVGENGDLTVYDFRYVWDPEGIVRRGYMADEVAEKHPEALGPELPGGYMTVDYSLLPEINKD